ncbi:MAG: AraC family transcriptional regulator [Pyrinomonadaceae bacterium]|jgi:AraC family transcriptional regulator of adaptative response/methylated-DNA-[protein]-cysteine methyltransferase|nr:AraC family transcriptional regulator [Pyrinomonadaceae bacterium]
MGAVLNEQMTMLPDQQDEFWNAVLSKDRAFDGQFVFAVSSTGIYCRPSCPSRRPKRENVSFFALPAAAESGGFRACLRCHPGDGPTTDPQLAMVQQVCRFIEISNGEAVTLDTLSDQVGVSSFHLQRTFKSVMGMSPSEYAETRRVNKFKQSVQAGEKITDAIYDAGFGSSSRLYELASSQLGMTPATYGKGGRGAVIYYAIGDSPLGRLLVAATDKGVCSVRLADSDDQLTTELRREFFAAEILLEESRLQPALTAVVDHLNDKTPRIDLPLDIRATAFQRQVWEQLQKIPAGETYSYSEVAKGIGQGKAVRAVARACASNPVALVIPCHRVIREDNSLGGYRWGLDRKKKLLERERMRAK